MKKNKKANIYDYVLSMFNSTDVLRPKLCKVGVQDDYLFATDSFTLAQVPASLSELDYEAHEEPIDYLSVFPKQYDTVFSITRDKLLSELTKAELIWRKHFKDCENCGGLGQAVCLCCDNEGECKDCDGTGESGDLEDFANIELAGNLIKFAGTKLHSTYLNKVLQVAYLLEQKEITVRAHKNQERKPVVFEIGNVIILVMPCINH